MANLVKNPRGSDWYITVRASLAQVLAWLLDHGEKIVDLDEYMYCFYRRETALAPKGAKIKYRGNGWWTLYGYSQYDRFEHTPDMY